MKISFLPTLRPAIVRGDPTYTRVQFFGASSANAGVAMFIVVPGEEGLPESAGMFDRVKARREVRPILQRFGLGFRIRIVIADMRPAISSWYGEYSIQLTTDKRPLTCVGAQRPCNKLATLDAVPLWGSVVARPLFDSFDCPA